MLQSEGGAPTAVKVIVQETLSWTTVTDQMCYTAQMEGDAQLSNKTPKCFLNCVYHFTSSASKFQTTHTNSSAQC